MTEPAATQAAEDPLWKRRPMLTAAGVAALAAGALAALFAARRCSSQRRRKKKESRRQRLERAIKERGSGYSMSRSGRSRMGRRGAEDDTDSEESSTDFVVQTVSRDEENAKFLQALSVRTAEMNDYDAVKQMMRLAFGPEDQYYRLVDLLSRKGLFIHSRVVCMPDGEVVGFVATTLVTIDGYDGGYDDAEMQSQQSLLTSLREMERPAFDAASPGDNAPPIAGSKPTLSVGALAEDEEDVPEDATVPLQAAAAVAARRGKDRKRQKSSLTGLAVAPIAVHPRVQRQRVGSFLLKHLLQDVDGYSYVVADLGDRAKPSFFERLQFAPAQRYGFVASHMPRADSQRRLFVLLKSKSRVLAFLRTRPDDEEEDGDVTVNFHKDFSILYA